MDGEYTSEARASFADRNWSDAYALFRKAEEKSPLAAEDLERLATSAYLIGRDEQYFSTLERAYHAYVDHDVGRATRCAFWLGLGLLFAGKSARASGWLARAQGHVDANSDLRAEAGYLLLPQIEQLLGTENWEAARTLSQRAIDVGEEQREGDLTACARHTLGRAFLGTGDLDEGIALLDQVMLDVTGGTLSPIMTGLLYCSVIDAFQQVYAVSRAREWTDALAGWCEKQPQLIAFSGTCLIHRAEIMQLRGKWPDAIREARRACDRYVEAQLRPAGAAFYQQAEVHRLRGEYEEAEKYYREANESGFEPQPGLALLRSARGNRESACATIRRLVAESNDPPQRVRLLRACVEIMLAAGRPEEARQACQHLSEIAERFGTEVLAAMSAQADAAVALAEDDPQRALSLGKTAFDIWQSIDAPYEAARARMLVGMACKRLDDTDGAELELEGAEATLRSLGAAPDIDRIEELRHSASGSGRDEHGLTPRELEVLQHLAAGKTNRAIAADLFLSEKTVDRHLTNIFAKLGVSTRTAAAAYAYQHGLIS